MLSLFVQCVNDKDHNYFLTKDKFYEVIYNDEDIQKYIREKIDDIRVMDDQNEDNLYRVGHFRGYTTHKKDNTHNGKLYSSWPLIFYVKCIDDILEKDKFYSIFKGYQFFREGDDIEKIMDEMISVVDEDSKESHLFPKKCFQLRESI